jgi:hypothetical protein
LKSLRRIGGTHAKESEGDPDQKVETTKDVVEDLLPVLSLGRRDAILAI